MVIREMTNSDNDFYQLIGPFLSRREIVSELGSPVWDDGGKRWFVAVIDGNVVGFAGIRESGRWSLLVSAYVVPEMRRQGVYTELLRNRMKAIGGSAAKAIATASAVPGLERHGFILSCMRGRYSVMVKE